MKIFDAVLLAGLFAAAAGQCADLNIKHLKVVDSEIEDRDFFKLTATLQVLNPAGVDVSVKDLIEDDIEVQLLRRNPPASLTLLESELFDADECTLRGSGKSAVCKEEYNRLTISEIKEPKNSDFIELPNKGYTYFKISIVIRKVDFTDELSENLRITIEVPTCPPIVQNVDCELKEFHSREQAICKKNVPL